MHTNHFQFSRISCSIIAHICMEIQNSQEQILNIFTPFKYMSKFQVEMLNYSTDIIMPGIKCQCTRFISYLTSTSTFVISVHTGLPDRQHSKT